MSELNQNLNGKAKAAALKKVSSLESEPTGLVQFHSQGKVIVIGDMDAQEVAPRINEKLPTTLVLTEGSVEPGATTIPVGGRSISLTGHLGSYVIQLGEEGKPTSEVITADLILDLSPVPLLAMQQLPPGYIHSSIEEPMLSTNITLLMDLVGTFEKPRYHEYDASLCAHSSSGKEVCTRCIDACPTDAIWSIGDLVNVDANLCQGGGVCATVCPSGAMRYSYPRAKDTLEQLRTLLRTYREEGGTDPVVVMLSDEDSETIVLDQAHHIPFVLEEIATVGIEVWLSTIAYGAKSVLLVAPEGLPPSVSEALDQQLVTASEILKGLGYSSELIQRVSVAELSGHPIPEVPPIQPAAFSGMGGKRQLAYMAIDHLYDQAPRSRPMATLSVGAPFGTASVDEQKCTLCMSCVGACPGKALLHGQDQPRLSFIEANCIQCGTCTRTCPEDAIWITPRLLFEREARNKTKILQEEEPFCCTSCGKPFATQTMIKTMKKKLEGHWMFQDKRSLNRLTQCEDCRVIDVVQDQEAIEKAAEGQILQ